MRMLLTVVAVLAVAMDADAFGGRRAARRTSGGVTATCTASGSTASASISACAAGGSASMQVCVGSDCAATMSVTTGTDALAEVNAKRAQRGLRPYLRDESLTVAAQNCAAERARRRLFGHTENDFRFLPFGARAAAAGCAAYPASYGWMSCAVYENHTYAGAAWVQGADGKRYMHLFVR